MEIDLVGSLDNYSFDFELSTFYVDHEFRAKRGLRKWSNYVVSTFYVGRSFTAFL